MHAKSIELVVNFDNCCEVAKIKFNSNNLKKRKEYSITKSRQR